jgi:hypothetical protein
MRVAALAAAAVVAACGGGGGDGPPAPTGSPTGLWTGGAGTGGDLQMLVFPGGETWGAYLAGNTLGVVQGTMGGAVTDFNATLGTVVSGTISGFANTKQDIYGFVTTTGGTAGYNGAYDAEFDQAPSLAAAAGTFTGAGPSTGTTFTLAAGGGITGAIGTCTFTGTAAPRADGNAFNVSLTYGGGTCSLGTATLTGVAHYSARRRTLVSTVINATRTASDVFFGSKP